MKFLMLLPIMALGGCLQMSPYESCQYSIKSGTYFSQRADLVRKIDKLETDLYRGYRVVEARQTTRTRIAGTEEWEVTESIVETQVPIDLGATRDELNKTQSRLDKLTADTQKNINRQCSGLSHVVPE